MSMQLPTIIALAPNSWDGQWVNRQHLLSRLGVHRKIVYSEGAWSVWDRNSADWRRSSVLGSFELKDNVLVDRAPRLMLRWPGSGSWNRAIVHLQARRLRARASGGPFIAYICHPSLLPYVTPLRPDYLVYHCYDRYASQPGWSAELAQAEEDLLKAADLVFACTPTLAAALRSIARCEPKVLPNGANVEAIFAAVKLHPLEPEDLAGIPHPRVGYLGSIHPQLDLELIVRVAARHPEWQFVLIGPEQNTSALHELAGYRACRQATNIHFLGAKHHSLVPAYLVHMDVNILFYRESPDSWTQAGYPLKLHEYLACGRPVVSAEHAVVREFSDVVSLATGVDGWGRALSIALLERDSEQRQRRMNIARLNSWDARVDVLSGWLDELPALKQRRLAASSDLQSVA
jgi:glycosyltransferase involved in cell wall biosynthesis